MVPHAVDILETLVLDDSSPGLFVALQRDADFPRFGEHFRIGHRRFIQQRVRSSQGIALDHPHVLAVMIAGLIEPCFVVEIPNVDHQGIALPLPVPLGEQRGPR